VKVAYKLQVLIQLVIVMNIVMNIIKFTCKAAKHYCNDDESLVGSYNMNID
jgi:hypothetical protein